MTTTTETPPARATWRDAFAVYLKPRVLIVLFLGFASGLPLALSSSTLAVWMREVGVDLGTIGLFTLVGTPYTIKFLWAPVVDALDVPVLTRLLGRRRGWLMLSQFMLMAAILILALCNPKISPLIVVAGAAILVAAASATQDILIDAFRVESLDPSEQAAGMASYVAAYRIGMLVSTAGTLYVVSGFEAFGAGKDAAWSLGYAVMAALVAIGMVTTLLATEPERSAKAMAEHAAHSSDNPVKRVAVAAYGAFSEFLTRDMAVVVLAFVVLYKFCDAFAGAMTAPFVIDLGFTRTDYANIVKGLGLAATLIGGFAGGFVARAYPLATSLWIGAFLQMASNLVFSWQALYGPQPLGAGGVDHHREFHQRDRHGDLHRVFVGALPVAAAHRDAVRATHSAVRRRPHLSVGKLRLPRQGDRLDDILRHQRAGCGAGHRPAVVAAGARTFPQPRPGEGDGAG